MSINRENAEQVAQFRTPPGMDWRPLADDIMTLLKGSRAEADELAKLVMRGRFFDAAKIARDYIRRSKPEKRDADPS